jgi:hypothetical protein
LEHAIAGGLSDSSSRRSQPATWFQLAKVRLTSRSASLPRPFGVMLRLLAIMVRGLAPEDCQAGVQNLDRTFRSHVDMKHLASMLALVAVTLAATALPFLPGRYDGLAVPLSGVARGLGMASLLLVPIGIVWLLYEWRRGNEGIHRGRAGFVIAILVAGSIAVFVATVLAFELSGATLVAGVLTAWALVLWRSGTRLLNWARRPQGRDLAVPLTLILVPIATAGAQLSLARPLTSLAWNRTMDGIAPLIADIEGYRVTNGHYPRSLFSEWCDYRPSVIGVSRYQYEPSGHVFSIAVEVPTFSFDSREFLLYNPADTHAMASHDGFLLRRTAAEMVHYRGYFRASPLERPHWAVLSYD